MDVSEILKEVKLMLNYGDNDEADNNLTRFIKAIIDYAKKAGVPEAVITSETSLDVIALGVEDLKTTKMLSDFVKSRITQLSMVTVDERL